jgi:prohibitin 2
MERPNIPDFFVRPGKGGDFDPDKFLGKYKYTIIGILALFLVIPNIVILVGAGQRAVVFNQITGMEKRVLEEGVQFIIPIIQRPSIYNVREISYVFSERDEKGRKGAKILGNSISTLTSDGQNISVDVTVRARPDFKELWWLHQNLGNDTYNSYVEKIIGPSVRSIVREVISGYTVSAIYSEDRKTIADRISQVLNERLAGYKIVLSEFLLNEVEFSRAYQNAIEEKQRARIELDTKDNVIVEEENKRDAAIIQAQGEADAIKLKVDALSRNPSYIKFKKAQVFGKRTKLIIDEKF